MAIDPLNLPKAAGLDFSEGDVKHLALGDEMSAISVGQATRNLAERDNILADKVQEIIGAVNNKEQYVNLPTLRTILPPLDEEVITNYRIASGFEARVLNAAVSSNPANSAKLEIFFSESFGASTGTSLVSTLTEFTGETTFHGTGEIIVKLTNVGAVSIEAVASIILTLRPIGETYGSLIGGGTKGDRGGLGPKGGKGDIGGPGDRGTPGIPGMVWRGPWDVDADYLLNDGVSYAVSGATSGYIATAANSGTIPGTLGAPWDVFASGAISDAAITYESRSVYGTVVTGGGFVAGTADGFYRTLSAGSTQVPFIEGVVKSGTDDIRGLSLLQFTRGLNFAGTLVVKLPQTGADGAEADYSSSSIALTAVNAGTTSVTVALLAPSSFYVVAAGTIPQRVTLAVSGVMPIV